MAKGDRTRARSVERFLDAGLAVFAERGFHAASMDEICTRAGLSRGAFYSNFPGKEALFLALFDRHAEHQIGRIAAAIDAAPTLDEAIASAALAAGADDPNERRWSLLTTEFTIYAARDDEAAARLTAHDRAVRARLADAIARFDVPPADAEALARFAIALYEGVMTTRLVDGDSAAAHGLLTRFLPAGLSTLAREPR
ncbi:Transcriptional regulator, TetR family OS=Tsukamurella paurometabola (strain ATCC 8368 / DSM/ CCUG 35730 / CIP 100753 / JCM 10117 / KCTC 9821 / NBRC 16120/ NCIMB 702349 / NCTC 13040) OX=521096 GN=Tpau_3995 PE=4 SV=1 [Tsukamurella paurometabola]|uniref:Transcriptional regulator, TetR family n=1 Tax=Tsukamurella paurometabola (strain ATCC 8368 / DSM 20162 / CCUG 35730 / CIP 100753 / JCM 10117 / KCTC 9821 / NBRC 16120 / NCIMB 702349 / NCTC 13040) TaxID=521096 RepID=D5UN71_TSUPD|nr:TetR/AcrR family transcriptional regulator [Tsukamurella paurometabola]ADG80566.1 transcriptional regulator, TetR family [Tsukamurella paurometabola DSM 20162]SUP40117.1 Solvent efflux pump srpABC operon corepressor [Tsukamurella paurometabola]